MGCCGCCCRRHRRQQVLLVSCLLLLLLLARLLDVRPPGQRDAYRPRQEHPKEQRIPRGEAGVGLPEAAQHCGVALHASILCGPLELARPHLHAAQAAVGLVACMCAEGYL